MTSGIVLSKVFGTNFYEVAGIGVNQCSTLLFFLTFYMIWFVLLLNHKASALLFIFKLFEVDTDSQKKSPLFYLNTLPPQGVLPGAQPPCC